MTLPSSQSFRCAWKNNLSPLASILLGSTSSKILVINASEEISVTWALKRRNFSNATRIVLFISLKYRYFFIFTLQIVVSEVPVQTGSYIFIIDKVLFPASIKKLVHNVCVRWRLVERVGPCGACRRISSRCEDGDDPVPDRNPQSVSLFRSIKMLLWQHKMILV